MNWEKVEQLITDKYISRQKHPDADLYIHNYSAKTQYESYWCEETELCRGLITDSFNNIIARPFRKFRNISQVPNLPAEPFTVTEKMDGSLGILYQLDSVPYIATRGSFVSDQAQKANEILKTKYNKVPFDSAYTYLFEIVYPANRIVVDYGDTEDLVLLTIIHTETGRELDYSRVYFFGTANGIPVVKQYDGITDFSTIEARDNAEGYVIHFVSGLRVKVKFEEYVRLHRLVTGVNAKTVWELLKNGDSYEELLERVPDEFYNWVKNTVKDLQEKYRAIEVQARHDFNTIWGQDFGATRKGFAEIAKTKANPNLLFALMDKKDYSQAIWKMLRPAAEKPFKDSGTEAA
jgi:RNA ligase